MANAADIAYDLLTGAGTLSLAWPGKVGRQLTEPDRCITIVNTGGLNPNPKWKIDYPGIQVRVRGNKNDYPGTFGKCQEVKDVLLGCIPQDITTPDGEVVRLDAINQQGDIATLGYDPNERPQFSLNFLFILEVPNSASTNREALTPNPISP